MSWGPCFFYYRCPCCGKLFKYALDLLPTLGQRFGCCPVCGAEGVCLHDGAIILDDAGYTEVEN